MKLFKLQHSYRFFFKILVFIGILTYFSIDCLVSSSLVDEKNNSLTICIYQINFKGPECIILDSDATKTLNESRHSKWGIRMLLPVKVQAKEDVILSKERILKAGKKMTIACHLNNYKDLSSCEWKDYIKLPVGFKPLQQQTAIVQLVQALKPEAGVKDSTNITTLIEILNSIKLSDNWVQEQFKPIDESEQLKK